MLCGVYNKDFSKEISPGVPPFSRVLEFRVMSSMQLSSAEELPAKGLEVSVHGGRLPVYGQEAASTSNQELQWRHLMPLKPKGWFTI